MKDALVFGGSNSLDFFDVRLGVIRIPEVSLRLQEAQKIWDRQCDANFGFHAFLISEDSMFFNNINLKSLCLSIVQLGLMDRYCRLFREPGFIIGNVQNESALQVATGQQTLAEMISNSRACTMARPLSPLQPVPVGELSTGLTFLNGQNLPQYQTFERVKRENGVEHKAAMTDDGVLVPPFMPIHDPEMKLLRAIEHAIDEKGVNKIVHVGPGPIDRSISDELEPRELQIVESIDIDPMLGWFWREMRGAGPLRAHA